MRRAKDRALNPTAREFDGDKLLEAVNAIHPGSIAGAELGVAAIMLAMELKMLRARTDRVCLAGLTAEEARVLAISELNRSFRVITDATLAQQDDGSGVKSVDALAQAAPQLAGRENDFAAADLIDAAVDATQWWVLRAARLPAQPEKVDLQTWQMAGIAMATCSSERAITQIWQSLLWDDHDLRVVDKGAFLHTPRDLESGAYPVAWNLRQQLLVIQWLMQAELHWRQFPEARAAHSYVSVKSAARDEEGLWSFEAGLIDAKASATAVRPFLAMEVLATTYLTAFADEIIVPGSNVSLRELELVCGVLSDAADAMSASQSTQAATWSDARSWAMIVRRSEIRRLLKETRNLEQDAADAIIAFLTHSNSSQFGLWGAAFMAIEDEALALCAPVLLSSNPLRRAEIWMKMAGLTDDKTANARGKPFERFVRSELTASIAGNALLTDAEVAGKTIPFKAGEEIDLLIRIGQTWFVGEVKCLGFPSDPVERYNQRAALERAAAQAARKAQWAIENWATIASVLKWKSSRPARVHPFVLQNHSFGAGLPIADVPVIDLKGMELMLGAGTFRSGGVMDFAQASAQYEETVLYTSQSEAEARMPSLLRDPPMIRRYVDHVEWREFPTRVTASAILQRIGSVNLPGPEVGRVLRC